MPAFLPEQLPAPASAHTAHMVTRQPGHLAKKEQHFLKLRAAPMADRAGCFPRSLLGHLAGAVPFAKMS